MQTGFSVRYFLHLKTVMSFMMMFLFCSFLLGCFIKGHQHFPLLSRLLCAVVSLVEAPLERGVREVEESLCGQHVLEGVCLLMPCCSQKRSRDILFQYFVQKSNQSFLLSHLLVHFQQLWQLHVAESQSSLLSCPTNQTDTQTVFHDGTRIWSKPPRI